MPTVKRSVRGAAGLAVRMVVDGVTLDGVAENFSCSGMFVQTEAQLGVGTRVQLSVELPAGDVVTLDATVARTFAEAQAEPLSRHPGLGLCFDDEQPNPEKLHLLGELLVSTRALAEQGASDEVLDGELARTPLRSVLSFLDVSRKSGRLELVDGASQAMLVVREGTVAWASAGSRAELEALLAWTSGTFRFECEPVGARGEPVEIADLLRS